MEQRNTCITFSMQQIQHFYGQTRCYCQSQGCHLTSTEYTNEGSGDKNHLKNQVTMMDINRNFSPFAKINLRLSELLLHVYSVTTLFTCLKQITVFSKKKQIRKDGKLFGPDYYLCSTRGHKEEADVWWWLLEENLEEQEALAKMATARNGLSHPNDFCSF